MSERAGQRAATRHRHEFAVDAECECGVSISGLVRVLTTHNGALREALEEIQDIIDNSYLLEAGRFRQIEQVFNDTARGLLKAVAP